MVVNFRARGISRDVCKLVRTPTLIKKNYHKRTTTVLENHKIVRNGCPEIQIVTNLFYYL
jgi:hypothetical protein